MTVTKTATAYFASGEIKFSDLRDTFKGSGTTIKASELFRDTDTNQPSPVVPDATENDNISANDYSTDFDGTNLSLLTFRNSIKQYDFTQTGTDVKLDIDEQDWNNNLPKNINKKFIVNGTIGSDDTSVAAASVDAEIRNLTIDVGTAGKIHGAGGAGGVYGTNSGKGGDGGTALYAKSTATDSLTKWIKVDLKSNSQIFAGGGGGGAGTRGGTGGTGASVHNLAGGAGGPGGNGGNGGVGQGYNSAATLGLGGGAGAVGADGNSKEWRKTNYDKDSHPVYSGGAEKEITKLDETLDTTETEIEVDSTAGISAGTNSYIRIGGTYEEPDEILRVSSVPDSTTLGVVRGQLGTSATTHNNNDNVYLWTRYMTTQTFVSGKGGTGGKGGDGGNGGDFGENGISGNNTNQGVGEKGANTDTLEYYKTPTNENFTSGMLVGYSQLNLTNFNTYPLRDSNNNEIKIATSYYSAEQPVSDSNGTTIGYKKLNFYDNSVSGSPNFFIEIITPQGGAAASNPRFTLDGYGLVADSSGKIRIQAYWGDHDQSGYSVIDVNITGGSGNAASWNRFGQGNYNTVAKEFDYNPVVTNGNVVVFAIFREAGHDNYITFGGKYDSSLSFNEPKFIDPAGGFPTFGPGINNDKTVDITHVNMPAGTIHGPIWGRDSANNDDFLNSDGSHKGIDIKNNATSSISKWGACMNDAGDDDDYNDLIVIPTDQRTAGTDLTTGSVLAPEPPALPTDVGTGGGAGRSLKGEWYDLIGGNSNNIKGAYLD